MTVAYDIATATVTGLMAGNEFAVAAFVHPQLHKLGQSVHAQTASPLASVLGKAMPLWYGVALLLILGAAFEHRPVSGSPGVFILLAAVLWAATIVFTTAPASSGVATPMTAETTVNTRNTSTRRRYRLANRQIRDSVPGAIDRCPTSARRDAARIIDHSPTPSIWRTRSLVTRTARWNAASAALLPEHPHRVCNLNHCKGQGRA